MNKSNLFFTLLLAVSAVLFTLGVIKKVRHSRGNAAGGKKVIAVIPKGTINMWWDVVRQGAVQAGEKYGVEMPITNSVNAIVNGGASASDEVRLLMSRERKTEV